MEALLVYYQTDEYRDLVIRQSLLLKKGDEHMYMLPESSGSKSVQDAETLATTAAQTPSGASHDPIWRQWVNYILHGQG